MSAAGAGRVPRLEDEVRRWAAQMPDDPAALSLATGRSMSWRELDESADRLVGFLHERGVRPGDRIAWLGVNDPSYLVVHVAARRARAVLAGLNWRLPPDELRRASAVVEPSVTIALEPMGAELDGEEVVVVAQDGSAPWDGSAPAPAQEPSDDDLLIMFFTSGSTGSPKAVALDRGGQDRAVSEATAFSFAPGDRLFIVPPQFHLAGATWSQYGLRYGATQVYSADTSPAGLVSVLAQQRITHALMVPTLLQMIVGELEEHPTDLAHLGDIAYGASPIAAPLLRRLLRSLPCRLTQVYGLSEAGGAVIELAPPHHDPDSPHLLAAGLPMNETRVKIVDPGTGVELPTGSVGELVLSSDHLMVGYWRRDDLTQAILQDGWLRTRDTARLDEDGFVYIEGRVDDMIITGGENVQPADVERVIAELDGVAECAVFGVPDPKWGTKVCAAVVAAPGSVVDEAAIIDWCKDRLAGYQCPRSVVIVETLPRNATGKILRHELAASADTEALPPAGN